MLIAFACVGYVSWIGDYATRDATLATLLYEAGAVPFVRTNIPQTLMVSLVRLIHFLYELILDLVA